MRVIGYIRLEFEGDNLYLHREDFANGLVMNAVAIERPVFDGPAEGVEGYVILEGTFDASGIGHLGIPTGKFRNITRLERWNATGLK